MVDSHNKVEVKQCLVRLMCAVESRIGLKWGLGVTPDELFTRSKSDTYPKSESTPARKFLSNPTL